MNFSQNNGGPRPMWQASSYSAAFAPRPLSTTNLYIRGLPPTTTDETLREMCGEYGQIRSAKAITDPVTSTFRGFAFVDFASEEDAATALNGLQARGMKAEMANARTTQQNGANGRQPFTPNYTQEKDNTNLYIANLPLSYTDTQLETVLQDYGSVVSTRIMRNHNGNGESRGFGFARMENPDACQKIIDELNGKVLPGSPEGTDPLYIKLADTNNRKKQTQMGMGMGGPQMMGYGGGQGFPRANQYARGGMNGAPYMMPPQQQFIMQPNQAYNGYAFNNLTNQMGALSMGGGSGSGSSFEAAAPVGTATNGFPPAAAPPANGAAAANGHQMYQQQGNYGYPNQYYSQSGMDGGAMASRSNSFNGSVGNYYGGAAPTNGGYGGHNGGAPGDNEPNGNYQTATVGGANGYGQQ